MFFRTSLRLFVYVLFPFVASQLEQPHRLDLIVRRDEARKRRPLIPIFEEDLKEEDGEFFQRMLFQTSIARGISITGGKVRKAESRRKGKSGKAGKKTGKNAGKAGKKAGKKTGAALGKVHQMMNSPSNDDPEQGGGKGGKGLSANDSSVKTGKR